MDKVNEHSKVMKFTQKVVDDRVDQDDFDLLKKNAVCLKMSVMKLDNVD